MAAAAAPPNGTSWTAEAGAAPGGPPASRAPPGSSTSPEYACRARATGSLYSIDSELPADTSAETTTGAWPSASGCRWDADAPSALPAVSSSAVWSTTSVPVAPVAAAPPPNETTWTGAGSPDGPAAVQSPPGESDTDAYAAGTRATGSLYSTVAAFGPVTLAERTVGAWPSASVRLNGPVPSGPPSGFETAAPSIVTRPVALDGAPPGVKAIRCSLVPSPPSPETALSRPATSSHTYADCGAVTGRSYRMVAASGAATTADTIEGLRASASCCARAASVPRLLGGEAVSSTSRSSIVMLPLAWGAAGLPANDTEWAALPLPSSLSNERVPSGPRSSPAYADSGAVTGSVYLTATVWVPVMIAETSSGRWPSSSRWRRSLSAPSGLPDTSASAAASRPIEPVVFVPAAGSPPSPTRWTAEPDPESDSTLRCPYPSSAAPEYAVRSPATGSLYVMARARGPVTLAETRTGAWPSARYSSNAVLPPSALPDPSVSAVSSTVSVPFELVEAATPSNETTCVLVELPSARASDTAAPPGERDSAEYADGRASTGSLYTTVRFPGPVTLAEATAGGMPSATSRGATDGSALPASSSRATEPAPPAV